MDNRQIVWTVILKMDKPFLLDDLFDILKNEHGIKNKQYILDTLAELMDLGLVSYSEIQPDSWKYLSRSFAAG